MLVAMLSAGCVLIWTENWSVLVGLSLFFHPAYFVTPIIPDIAGFCLPFDSALWQTVSLIPCHLYYGVCVFNDYTFLSANTFLPSPKKRFVRASMVFPLHSFFTLHFRNHPEIFLEGFGFLDQGLLQHGAGNGAGIGTNGRPRSMRRIRIINNNGRNRNAAQAGNNNGGATGENVPSTPNQSNISSGGRGGFGRSRAGGSSATPAWAATNSAAMSRHVPHSEVVEDKIFRRCPEWPRCCLGNNCSFQHPTRPCRNGRNCPYGDNCCFLHDGEVAVP